jgi:hypothetical protein
MTWRKFTCAGRPEMNASFDGRPVQLELESHKLVLIDPLALDGLAEQLAAVGGLAEPEQIRQLSELGRYGLRIGLHPVPNPAPGMYEIGLDAFEAVASDSPEPGVFDIDTGTVVVIDLSALTAVARIFTWDRYDALMQAAPGDETVLEMINAEVGGPRFAIIAADAATPFSGDGAFRLRRDVPKATS